MNFVHKIKPQGKLLPDQLIGHQGSPSPKLSDYKVTTSEPELRQVNQNI